MGFLIGLVAVLAGTLIYGQSKASSRTGVSLPGETWDVGVRADGFEWTPDIRSELITAMTASGAYTIQTLSGNAQVTNFRIKNISRHPEAFDIGVPISIGTATVTIVSARKV